METGGSVGIDSSNGNDGDNNDGSDDVKTNNGGLWTIILIVFVEWHIPLWNLNLGFWSLKVVQFFIEFLKRLYCLLKHGKQKLEIPKLQF